MVERLDFKVPEFVRPIWVSNHAREVWSPRINKVSNLWNEIERLAVALKYKNAALQQCAPHALIDLSKWCMQHGLVSVPLMQQGAVYFYANAEIPFDPSRSWEYKVIIGIPSVVERFVEVWKTDREQACSDILGYPKCCQEFFTKYWIDGGWRDLTYPMVLGGHHGIGPNYSIPPAPYNNVLLRYLGVRAVSHLPCSFDCEPTRQIGAITMEIAREYYPVEASWLTEMLNWPVRWDSLHGIAIITTPVIRIVTSTDAFAGRTIVDLEGTSYPQEGAIGLDFPFRQSTPIKIGRSKDDLHIDNGFASLDSMEQAHKIILSLIEHLPVQLTPKVIDLGCGNGLLLDKIGRQIPHFELSGIEVTRSRWERAVHRMNGSKVRLANGDLNDDTLWEPPYGLTLLSLNRLKEIDERSRNHLLERTSKGSEFLLLYSYSGDNVNVIDWQDYFTLWLGEDDRTTNAHLLKSTKV